MRGKDSEPRLACTFSARLRGELPFRCVARRLRAVPGRPGATDGAPGVAGRQAQGTEGMLGTVTPLGSVTVVAPEGGVKRLLGGEEENLVSSK